jgi:hypothetical protein
LDQRKTAALTITAIPTIRRKGIVHSLDTVPLGVGTAVGDAMKSTTPA